MASNSSSSVPFQSSYSSYAPLHKEAKGQQRKMASRGRREAQDSYPLAHTELPQSLARIDTDVLNRIKIFLASEQSSGENFSISLKQIKDVLESVVLNNMPVSEAPESTHIRNIYNIITEKLISYLPKIKQSQKEVALLLVDILCLLSALKTDTSLTFPEVFASCLLYFQPESVWGDAYKEVVGRLCHYVLPHCLVSSEYRECLSLTSALMMVLETCDSIQHHLLVIDTLMILKRDVCLDVLKLITYGTPTVRSKALDLLLHYWPIPIKKFSSITHHLYGEWTPPRCENSTCRHSNNIATTLCLDHACAAQHKAPGSMKVYLLLCHDCDSTIHSDPDSHQRHKLPMPLREVKPNCEFQRICSGKENKVNKAVVTCYNDSCTAIQNGQPIRMCFSCHSKQHRDLRDPTHIYQVGLPDPWVNDDMSSSSTMLEAVSKLIEVVPVVMETPSRSGTTPRISTPHIQRNKQAQMMIKMDTSKRGIWLLSHYCRPTTEVRANQREWLIHLLALVLEWLQTYYDILQAAIVKMEEQLTSAGAAAVAAGAEGQEWVDSDLYNSTFEKLFTNYSEFTTLIESHLLYWVRSVCDTNSACMVEVLKPDIPGCAQVGKMWNKSHDSISRYKRTLTIIYRLDKFHQQGKLDSFPEVFNTVMPLWMEKLIDLRAEPGRMEGLQDQLRLIFSTQNKKHDEGLRIFNFIWEKFRSDNHDEQQRGLFWLQDLTRLRIPVPYLPHMFDDALKESRGFSKYPTLQTMSSSFDLGIEEERTRKESTGSFTASGSESEPHLLSQSSIEQTVDTQVIVNLRSSLTQYILMLDVWFSQLTQLPESVPTLEFSVFQNHLTTMLRKVWGGGHDHKDATSVCYLCQGVIVWFSMASKLLEEYAKLVHREGSAEDCEDLNSPYHRPSTRSDKLRQLVFTHRSDRGSETSETSGPQGVGRKPSVEWLDDRATPPQEKENKKFGVHGGIQALHGGVAQFPEDGDQQHQPYGHKRKIAQVQSHSHFRVVSDTKLRMAAKTTSDVGKEAIPSTYVIFQLCIMKLRKATFQPEALLRIVSCLMTLLREWRVLEACEDKGMVYRDVAQLFTVVWSSLEANSSNTVQTCVDLLLECAKYLANAKPVTVKKSCPSKGGARFANLSDSEEKEGEESMETGIEEQLLWETIHNALTSSRWAARFKSAEMFSMVVQFMRKPTHTEVNVLTLDSKVQASLAHGFCLLVQLLVDKNSNVCTRAKYLLPTIKESSLEAMKLYLKNFFFEFPAYRTEVLSMLSLIDSSLPELNFLSVDFLLNLLRIATNLSDTSSYRPVAGGESDTAQPDPKKKASDVSVFAGPSPKLSIHSAALGTLDEDPAKVKILEKILSLLLRHLANPRVDIAESMKKAQGQRSKKAGTIKGRRSTPSSFEEHLLRIIRVTIFHDLEGYPQEIRKSPVFEVFLNHIFPVLDHNIEFGQTKGMLPFILRMLCFSAAPDLTDYATFKAEERRHQQRDPRLLNFPPNACSYSLSSLPPRLRAPWLRVFFVILYKYIHDYSEVDPGSHFQGWEVLTLTQWCMQITLNTVESDPHVCSALLGSPKRKPMLQHQPAIDSSLLESLKGSISVSKERSDGPGRSKRTAESAENAEAPVEEAIEPGICAACKKPTKEYSEEVIAVATVALGTCCHRLPHTVSGYLVSRIIPAVARVVVPGAFSWQANRNTGEPPPGSAMAVAKHIMGSILTQFGDRRLFLFVFGTNFNHKCRTVFTALAHGLIGLEREATTEGGDGDTEGDLNETTIVKYFLQDAVSSIKDLHSHSIINLAMYIETLDQIEEGAANTIQLTKELLLWDSFCKKLKSNSDVLRNKKSMHAFLRVIIKLFRNCLEHPSPPTLGNYHTHTVLSLSQSLLSIIEFALYNVYVPLGGLVELGSVWYRLFQQHSHREAEKLMKLYVSELRKSLKARVSGGSELYPRADNFLGLVQVLLLEESGYLGYVDSLTTKKSFAPDLKVDYETYSIPVITALQWDFVDVLCYISSPDASAFSVSDAPLPLLAQLKLSLAQLVALRAQHHGRSPPTERLKRLVSGDPRSLLPPPTTFRSTVIHVLQPRWQDFIKAIHLLSWLLLGAMSHNYIDAIAANVAMVSSIYTAGPCHLLESLNPKLDEVTKGILALITGVLQRIAVSNDGNFGYLYLTFLFASTWTAYMELYTKESMPLIVEFWQKLIGRLTHLMSADMSEIYQMEVIETLNKFVVVRIKEMNLSCYSLLVPIWREATCCITGTVAFPNIEGVQNMPVDRWLKETIHELVTLEQEWQTDT